jgi:hypothetical protein
LFMITSNLVKLFNFKSLYCNIKTDEASNLICYFCDVVEW